MKKVRGLIKSKDEKINKEIRQNQQLRDQLHSANVGHMEAGRDIYIYNFSDIPGEAIKKRMEKQIHPNEDFRIADTKFDEETMSYEEKFDFTNDELLRKILPLLNAEFRSILNLAIAVENNFKSGNKLKADKIRYEIPVFYGKMGNKLCKLYTSGYINKAINYVYTEKGKTSDEELGKMVNLIIEELLEGPANYIFFVDEKDKFESLVFNAKKSMEDNISYIAFHGAGLNAITVLKLIDFLQRKKMIKENYELVYRTEPISYALFFTAKLFRKDTVK